MTKVRNEYTEVLELLKYISEEDYSKIPQEKIEFYEKYKNPELQCSFDEEKEFIEQDFSRKSYVILLSLYMDYILSEEDRKIVNDILILNDKKAEKEKEINFTNKFNATTKKSNREEEDSKLNVEDNNEDKAIGFEKDTQMILVDETENGIFGKLITKIKKIIKCFLN